MCKLLEACLYALQHQGVIRRRPSHQASLDHWRCHRLLSLKRGYDNRRARFDGQGNSVRPKGTMVTWKNIRVGFHAVKVVSSSIQKTAHLYVYIVSPTIAHTTYHQANVITDGLALYWEEQAPWFRTFCSSPPVLGRQSISSTLVSVLRTNTRLVNWA